MNDQASDKRDNISRRAFVKGSAAAVGGLMASQFPLRAGGRPIEDTIRVGLIGCGGRGSGAVVQALRAHENVQLVAMADAFRDRLDDCYETITTLETEEESDEEESETAAMEIRNRIQVPEEHKFAGFEAYRQVLPLVDVVILTTPPAFRPIHFDAAIEADKHVFMEKPVATDVPGVRQVLQTAEKAKQKQLNVVVGLQRHYQTVYREWMERIHDGAIGEVILGRVYWNSSGVWVRERQPQWNEMEYQMRNWYYFTWLCGDHILEQHIHNIDVANWAKQGHPVRAQGQGGRLVRTGPEHGQIFDHHFVEFEYADGSRVLSQCRHMPGCMSRVSEAFHGTEGTAPRPGELYDRNGNVIYQHQGENDPNPYQVEHNELFDAIVNGEYRYADAERGATATMTAILGRMATYTGQMVEWDEAVKSQESLMPERFAWDAAPPVLPGEDGEYPVPTPGVSDTL